MKLGDFKRFEYPFELFPESKFIYRFTGYIHKIINFDSGKKLSLFGKFKEGEGVKLLTYQHPEKFNSLKQEEILKGKFNELPTTGLKFNEPEKTIKIFAKGESAFVCCTCSGFGNYTKVNIMEINSEGNMAKIYEIKTDNVIIADFEFIDSDKIIIASQEGDIFVYLFGQQLMKYKERNDLEMDKHENTDCYLLEVKKIDLKTKKLKCLRSISYDPQYKILIVNLSTLKNRIHLMTFKCEYAILGDISFKNTNYDLKLNFDINPMNELTKKCGDYVNSLKIIRTGGYCFVMGCKTNPGGGNGKLYVYLLRSLGEIDKLSEVSLRYNHAEGLIWLEDANSLVIQGKNQLMYAVNFKFKDSD